MDLKKLKRLIKPQGNSVSGPKDIALAAFMKQAAQAGPSRKHVAKYEPSTAQKEKGNYPKLHLNMHGLRISIENPRGSYRRGVSDSGDKWSTRMTSDYGYVVGTSGADNDQIDVFLSQRAPEATVVHIVDQVFNDKFDEHKCMIGWSTQAAAGAQLSQFGI